MPVEIRNLPEPKVLPKPPEKMRWLVFIVICTLTGFILTLYFWPEDKPANTIWFWICATLTPSALGLICYAIRLHRYEHLSDQTSHWNQLYIEELKSKEEAGQQALGMLGMAYVTPAAKNKLAAALLLGASPLQTVYCSRTASVVSNALLHPPAKSNTVAEYCSRLEMHLYTLLRMLTPELEQYALNEPVTVRIRHDQTVSDTCFLSIWQRIFPERYALHPIIFRPDDDGLMWLDEWLDEQSPSLVLSVQVNLFGDKADNQAESISLLLLASPAWIKEKHTSPLAFIHRPVPVIKAVEAIDDVVRWGKLSPDEGYFNWRSQLTPSSQTEIIEAMDAKGYLFDKDREYSLDNSFGKPDFAVGNITLICACEHANSTQEPQWIMLEDKMPQCVIVRPA